MKSNTYARIGAAVAAVALIGASGIIYMGRGSSGSVTAQPEHQLVVERAPRSEDTNYIKTEPYMIKWGDTLSEICETQDWIRDINRICIDHVVALNACKTTPWGEPVVANADLIQAYQGIEIPVKPLGRNFGP